MAGGLYLFTPDTVIEHPSLLLAWPVAPFTVWALGRTLTRKSQQPDGGPLAELTGLVLRTVGLGLLLAPTLVGNQVAAVLIPATWVYAAGVFGGWPADRADVQIARFLLLLFCGFSLVFHLILDHYRAKQRQPKVA